MAYTSIYTIIITVAIIIIIIINFAEGRLAVNVGLVNNISEVDVMRANPEVLSGGKWRPTGCVARHKVAHWFISVDTMCR